MDPVRGAYCWQWLWLLVVSCCAFCCFSERRPRHGLRTREWGQEQFWEFGNGAGNKALKPPQLQSTCLDPNLIVKSSLHFFQSFIFSLNSPIFTATFAKNRGGLMKANESQDLHDNTSNFNLGLTGGNFSLGMDVPNMPRQNMVDERNARSYQSWLNWWKSTISSEDYTKYMFTQQ